MKSTNDHYQNSDSRRSFIGKLAATAGVASLAGPLFAENAPTPEPQFAGDADEWFKNVKGKHRVVYDAPEPHMGFPIIWSWAYYLTNNQTGTADNDMTSVVVLRHNAIPFAMEDKLWEKYKFGETFKITDNTTGAPAIRNPYYTPKEGDFPVPGIDGIKAMIGRGAMFCVCNLALSVYSGMVAQKMGKDPKEVMKEWVAGVLPNVQVVPSGVWALGRAQENNCGYIYAGG